MTRLQVLEPSWLNGEGGTSSVTGNAMVGGRLFDQVVFASRSAASAFTTRTYELLYNTNTYTPARPTIYWRVYIRLRKLATNGVDTRLLGIWGGQSFAGAVSETGTALIVNMTAAGGLRIYSRGAGAAGSGAIGSASSALSVGTWYRVEGSATWNGNQLGNTGSYATLVLDGTTIATGASPQNFGLGWFGSGGTNPLGGNVFGGRFILGAEDETGDAQYDLCYFSADTAALPGAAHVLTAHPSGPGTYSTWAGNWQAVAEDRADVNTALALTSSTSGAKHSLAVESLKSINIRPTNVVKSLSVIAKFPSGSVTQAGFLLRKNGVEFLSPVYGSLSNGGHGWLFDVGTIGTVHARDTLEIGVVHDGTTNTANLLCLSLVVEFEPAVNPIDHRVHVLVGNYTGNDTGQDITVGHWRPDLVLIAPSASTGKPVLKFRNCLYGVVDSTDPTPTADLVPRTTATGFTVGSTLARVNAAGVAYTYLAIQDQGGVLCDHGGFAPGAGSPDSVDQALNNVAFVPDMLWAMRQSTSPTQAFYARHSSQVGDLAAVLGSDDASLADAIQSMGLGTFQVGTLLTQNTPYNLAWLAWRTSNFNVEQLAEIYHYTGDGTGSRVINLSALTKPLAWVLVIPSTTEARHFKHTGHAAASSQEFVSGVVRSGASAFITAMSGKTFTVAGTNKLNTSGTEYYVIGFASGDDADEPVFDDNADAGLTWVEITDRAGDILVYSKIALPDRLVYYGGYKEPRVTQWGTIKRDLSDDFGQYVSTDFQFTLDDTDRTMRGLLAANSTRYFRNMPAVARMIADPGRRLEKTPRTVVRGTVNDYTPQAGLSFSFTVQDQLAAQFSKQTSLLPQRVITIDDFPNCPTGASTDTSTGKTYTSTSVTPPAGYVQLSDQAAAKNLLGQVSNGTYGPAEARGWYGYDGTGTPFAEGGWRTPMVSGDVYFATQDVATALESAGGGSSSVTSLGLPVPIIYGAVTDTNVVAGADSGIGQCPAIYVGDYVLGDARTYHKFLICGHAVLSIDGVYTDNGATGIGTSPASQVGDLSVTAGSGADWLVPGYDGWTDVFGDPTPYEDINGNRYTTIYGLVGNHQADVAAGFYPTLTPGSVALAVSVQGIEDEGDATGDLITDLLLQYRHCLQNWVFGNYASGPWLDTPYFDDDPAVPVMDDDSFDAASTLAQSRVPGGYRGDFMIGYTGPGSNSGSFLQLRDLLTRFNQSADVNCAFNRRAQFFVSMLDDTASAAATATNFSDLEDVFAATFNIQDDLPHQYNDVPFYHTEDFLGRLNGSGTGTSSAQSGWASPLSGVLDVSDAASITGNGVTLIAPPILMYMVRGQNVATDPDIYAQGTLTALDVARRFLVRHKDPPRYVTFKVGLPGVNVELGDIVTVTHFEGVGSSGWTDRPVRVVQHEVDPNDYSVLLRCYDMQELLDTAFVLGDRSALPATWTAATPTEQAYAYLADRTTGEFSDMAAGKALR